MGAALLDPDVTRRLVGRYAARIRPAEGTARDIPLTPREMEVLRLIADGLSNSEIAAALVISPETVKTFVSRILTKLDLRDRVQAVVFAVPPRAGDLTPGFWPLSPATGCASATDAGRNAGCTRPASP
ncbi:HTH-type transcriptional regulator MalT [Streptomyces violaceorubidus]